MTNKNTNNHLITENITAINALEAIYRVMHTSTSLALHEKIQAIKSEALQSKEFSESLRASVNENYAKLHCNLQHLLSELDDTEPLKNVEVEENLTLQTMKHKIEREMNNLEDKIRYMNIG